MLLLAEDGIYPIRNKQPLNAVDDIDGVSSADMVT